jgi:hypothetical protein
MPIQGWISIRIDRRKERRTETEVKENEVSKGMSKPQNGKGDTPRPYDKKRYSESWDRIFKKKSQVVPPRSIVRSTEKKSVKFFL